MDMICPRCERPVIFISRSYSNPCRRRPEGLSKDIVTAVTADGLCTTCWRATKGKPRPSLKGLLDGIKYPPIGRGPLTDEQIEQARQDIERFWADRRARGIPEDGLDPSELLLKAA